MSFPIAFPAFTHPDKAIPGTGDWLIASETPTYYLLEFNAPPDNRFSTSFLSHYIDALDYIRLHGALTPKVLVTTSRIPKFFSNGLDLESWSSTPDFISSYYYKAMRTILEFPWPTVALINGHAFAAGFMIAVSHDYRIMNGERGYLCLNEIEFGADLYAGMMSIFRVKFGVPVTFKSVIKAHRWTAAEALEVGLVDGVGGLEEVEELVRTTAGKYAASRAYKGIRRELLREVIKDTQEHEIFVRHKEGSLVQEAIYYETRARQLDEKIKAASKL